MEEKNLPLISLIIPVYNAEKLLEQCMACALSQSYPNYEVLLIDDGSADATGEICDGYAGEHPGVSAIHHGVNRGLSAARNTGVANASGEYICFMDVDDIVSGDYLYKLYRLCRELDVPIAACNHNIVRGNSSVPRFPAGSGRESLDEYEACENILYQRIPDVSAWGKLYRREVLENVVYPEGKLYEDTARIAEILFNAGRIGFTHEPLYDYIISANTLSHGSYSPSRWEYIEAVDHMTGLIENRYPELKRACLCRRVFAALSVRRYFAYDPEADPDSRKKLESFIRKNAAAVLFNSRTPARDKIAVAALMLGRRVYDALWKAYDSRRGGSQ